MSSATFVDHGWAELKKQMRGRTITIKVWDEACSESRSKSHYSKYVEEGTPKMAARPFMAETMARHDGYQQQLRDALDCVLAGTDTLDEMMEMLAGIIDDDMRNMIEEMGLVKTGRLHDKVRHSVDL